MVYDLLVADHEALVIGSMQEGRQRPVGSEGFHLVATNNYGRGSNSMSPFRMARMAACVRS